METKTCTRCGETKPISEFYTTHARPGGKCKTCFRAVQAEGHMKPPKFVTPPGTKRCTLCKETKPDAEFFANKDFHDGLDRGCKQCRLDRRAEYGRKNSAALSKKQMERYHKDPERFADYDLRKRFGLPPGSYDKMSEAQGGRCAICQSTTPGGNGKRRLAVDHDGATGKVRGLLCGRCNTGIGQLQHNETILLAAIAYLKKYA